MTRILEGPQKNDGSLATTAEDRGDILKEIKLKTTQATVRHQFTLDIRRSEKF